jgi:hypothetical protein
MRRTQPLYRTPRNRRPRRAGRTEDTAVRRSHHAARTDAPPRARPSSRVHPRLGGEVTVCSRLRRAALAEIDGCFAVFGLVAERLLRIWWLAQGLAIWPLPWLLDLCWNRRGRREERGRRRVERRKGVWGMGWVRK